MPLEEYLLSFWSVGKILTFYSSVFQEIQKSTSFHLKFSLQMSFVDAIEEILQRLTLLIDPLLVVEGAG